MVKSAGAMVRWSCRRRARLGARGVGTVRVSPGDLASRFFSCNNHKNRAFPVGQLTTLPPRPIVGSYWGMLMPRGDSPGHHPESLPRNDPMLSNLTRSVVNFVKDED